jgi:hypothetical protein
VHAWEKNERKEPLGDGNRHQWQTATAVMSLQVPIEQGVVSLPGFPS